MSNLPMKKHILAIMADTEGNISTTPIIQAMEQLASTQKWKIQIKNRGVVSTPFICPQDIAQADLILVVDSDTSDLTSFIGKPLYHTTHQHLLANMQETFQHAFDTAEIYMGSPRPPTATQNTYLGKCSVKKNAHPIARLIVLFAIIFTITYFFYL